MKWRWLLVYLRAQDKVKVPRTKWRCWLLYLSAQDEVKVLMTCLPVCPGRSEDVNYAFTCLPRMKWKQPRGSWTSTRTCWRHATRTSPPPPQNSERYRRSPVLHSSRFRSCSTKWPKFKRTHKMPLDRLGNAWGGGGIYLFSWSRISADCILWFKIEVSFCTRFFSEPWSWKVSEQTASHEYNCFQFLFEIVVHTETFS